MAMEERHPAPVPLRVLLIEDEPDDAVLTLRYFQRYAPHVRLTTVHCGGEGLEAARSGQYDAAILDHALPDMDGLAVLGELVRLEIPTLVVTGRGDQRTAVAAMKAGAVDYIVKDDGYLALLPEALSAALTRSALRAENRRLQAELARRATEAEAHAARSAALSEILALITLTTDVPAMLANVLPRLARVLDAPFGCVLRISPDDGRLTLHAAVGLPIQTAAPLPPLDQLPTLRAALAGRAPKMLEQPPAPPGGPLACFGPNTLVLPLLDETILHGAILLGRERQHERFGGDALAFARDVMGPLALAIARGRMVEALVAEGKRLHAILNSMGDALCAFDRQGRLVLRNAAAESLPLCPIKLGDSGVEHMALYPLQDAHGRPLPPESHPLARALRGEQVVNLEINVPHPDGRRSVVAITATPLLDASEQVQGAVLVYRDVTAARALERAKDEFLDLASHELKTPLTSLKGYAELLLRRLGGTTSEAGVLLKQIERQVDHMARLINHLLEVTAIHADRLRLRPEPLDLAELARDVASRLHALSPQHRLEVIASAPVEVRGDREQLAMVITNLVENAVKFSPAGGTVTVVVEATATLARLAVADTGVGIPTERQPELFARFHQLDASRTRRYGGLGLGLYVSRALVELHGGSMGVQSEPGHGSIFSFVLPRETA